MADQGVWFKLWTTALHDPDLGNLPLEDFARWALLGTYVKAHGTGGRLRLTPPARALCGLLQVPDFEALRAVFHRLPNVDEEMITSAVSPETSLTVSFRNWAKYQGDYSTARVRKFREMKRLRGEEKRGEEKRIPPKAPQGADNGFATFWAAYPRKEGKGKAEEAWRRHAKAVPVGRILEGVEKWQGSKSWAEGYVAMPATWLNQKRWEDDPVTAKAASPHAALREMAKCAKCQDYHFKGEPCET